MSAAEGGVTSIYASHTARLGPRLSGDCGLLGRSGFGLTASAILRSWQVGSQGQKPEQHQVKRADPTTDQQVTTWYDRPNGRKRSNRTANRPVHDDDEHQQCTEEGQEENDKLADEFPHSVSEQIRAQPRDSELHSEPDTNQ